MHSITKTQRLKSYKAPQGHVGFIKQQTILKVQIPSLNLFQSSFMTCNDDHCSYIELRLSKIVGPTV